MNRLLICITTAVGLAVGDSYAQTDEPAESVSMSQTYASSQDGTYRYYKKGEEQPFTGVLYAKYPNGNYKSWQEYENGVGEGTWINYYENRNVKEQGTYRDNRVEGPVKMYYENGNLKASGQYRDWRIRVGTWTYYDENGQEVKTEDYGKEGDFRDVEYYYQSGQISEGWYQQIIGKNKR